MNELQKVAASSHPDLSVLGLPPAFIRVLGIQIQVFIHGWHVLSGPWDGSCTHVAHIEITSASGF